MLKRIISIGLILIMAAAIAAPVIHIECDMPCCEKEVMTCCDDEKAYGKKEGCSMSQAKCEHSQFVPIVSGPKSNKKSFNVDLDKPTYAMKASKQVCQLKTTKTASNKPTCSMAKTSTQLRL